MNQPEILNTIELLRIYKSKKAWSNSELTDSLTLAGWTWQESFVTDLLAGRKKPTEEQNMYIRKYLLSAYHGESLA